MLLILKKKENEKKSLFTKEFMKLYDLLKGYDCKA